MPVTCSIVIPTRNCLTFLPTCLASIDGQFINDAEVVVVDDGSTDGTADWFKAGPRSRFPVRLLETGGIGPARARNAAIAVAQGNLIAFLDADDYWWPGKLAAQLAFHSSQPAVTFSFTDYMHLLPDGRTVGTCFDYWRCDWTPRGHGGYELLADALSRLLATNVVGTSCVIASRSALERVGGFDATRRSAEDWDLWLRLAALGPVGCSAAVTMSYLMRPGSETAARGRRIDAMSEIIATFERPDSGVSAASLRVARARIAAARADLARGEARPWEAARAEFDAFLGYPNPRSLKATAADLLGAVRGFLPTNKVRG